MEVLLAGKIRTFLLFILSASFSWKQLKSFLPEPASYNGSGGDVARAGAYTRTPGCAASCPVVCIFNLLPVLRTEIQRSGFSGSVCSAPEIERARYSVEKEHQHLP